LNDVMAQSVIQECGALAKEPHFRNVHDSLLVKVGYEAVAITENRFRNCAKLLFSHSEGGTELFKKCVVICNYPPPVMFAFTIGKELAPIKDRDVEGVRVRADPELTLNAECPMLPPGSIERDVSQTVATKQGNAADALRVFHAP